jgi:periplasmic divalent cation tolerance protein
MDQSDRMIVIYTTFPSDEDARRTGRLLIERCAAACVNMFPGMSSIYRWEGKIEEAKEVAMIVKTRESLRAEAMALIAGSHPYTVPALLVFNPAEVASSYEAWLREATRKDTAST